MGNEAYDFLTRNMEENWLHARQAEEKRALTATINLVLASALQAIFVFAGWNIKTLPLAIWIVFLGVYGVLTTLKLYERSQFHILRARKLRARLDELWPDAQVERLQQLVESEHKRRYPFWMHTRLNTIWLSLHLVILVVGIIFALLCLVK